MLGTVNALIAVHINLVLFSKCVCVCSFLFSRKQKRRNSWASSTSTVCTSSQLHYWPTPQRKNLAKVLNICIVCGYMCGVFFFCLNINLPTTIFNCLLPSFQMIFKHPSCWPWFWSCWHFVLSTTPITSKTISSTRTFSGGYWCLLPLSTRSWHYVSCI